MKTTRFLSPLFASAYIILLCAVVCGLTGCLSRPALTKQTFSFSLSPAIVTNGFKSDLVLGIRSLEIAAPFDGRPLVYRTGEYTYESDPYAEFLESPADALRSAIQEWFGGTGDFRAVTESGSALRPNRLVEINVSQMYGDFRQPNHPTAVMAIRFVLFDSSNGVPGKAIFQKKYVHRISLSAPTAVALVAGWHDACDDILGNVSADFSELKK